MSPLQRTTLIAIIYIQTCISASLTKTIQTAGEIWLQSATIPTIHPTTEIPTNSPINKPTMNPTDLPTEIPTIVPTETPTNSPTIIPTINPTRAGNHTTIPTANPSITPTFMPTNNPSFNPSKNSSKSPTVIPTVFTGKPTYEPSIIPSIVFIKENNNNNLNNNNANIIEKNSPLRYLPLIIIIVFITMCCWWMLLWKCARRGTKKHRNSTISINDDSDNDENKDIEMVENDYEYCVEFISKPFGIVFTNSKYDKTNVFIESVEFNSFAETNGVIIGSKIIKFENENVENMGAKNIQNIFKETYLNKLPLKITFRTQSQYKSSPIISTAITSTISTSTNTDSILNQIYTSIIMNNDLYEV